jgi:hypothetical protein
MAFKRILKNGPVVSRRVTDERAMCAKIMGSQRLTDTFRRFKTCTGISGEPAEPTLRFALII